MVPYEGAVARYEVHRAVPRLMFVPEQPGTGAEVLVDSSYKEAACFPHAALWVLTTMSPHLQYALPHAAKCGHLLVAEVAHFGSVTVAHLVPDGAT
jgi:hypothetical protein